MYSREETKQLRQEFWTRFGQFMSLHPSADGERINWINYKTGVKYLVFKMDADQNDVRIAIQWSQPDADIRELMEEQFLQYKNLMRDILGEDWIWDMGMSDEYGRPVCAIYQCLRGKNILRREDWGDIIAFLKPRLLAVDEFWSNAKYAFELFK